VDPGSELRQYVVAELGALDGNAYFDYAIQDAVRGYAQLANARATIVRERIARIIDLE